MHGHCWGVFIHSPKWTERYFVHQDARYENQKRDWTNVAYNVLYEQGKITQTVACNLLHEKDGIKQTTCLNERSLLEHFYPYTQFNGKVFRASRCTLRESKTQFNQRRVQRAVRTRQNHPDRSVQLVARIRQNYPDNTRKSAVEK